MRQLPLVKYQEITHNYMFLLKKNKYIVCKNKIIMSTESPIPISNRLYSLDALRGFDMFWIMGNFDHGIIVLRT